MAEDHVPPDAPLQPAEEAEIRRRLAAVPPAGPMPAPLVTRLEARLEALMAERAAERAAEPAAKRATGHTTGHTTGPSGEGTAPADLAARRTARRGRPQWRVGLVAAASVAILGVGVSAVVDGLSGQDSAEHATSAGAADSSVQREAESAPAGEDSRSGAAGGGTGGGTGGAVAVPPRALIAETPERLSSETLTRDVARLVRDTGGRSQADGSGPDDGLDPAKALGNCELPVLGADDEVAPVRLDGQRATLVVRSKAVEGGTREVQIYPCDGRDVLATVRVRVADGGR